jgi:hypothetical protein
MLTVWLFQTNCSAPSGLDPGQAQLVLFGTAAASVNFCLSAALSWARGAGAAYTVHTYVCVRSCAAV